MKFEELTQADKVDAIKTQFNEILESVILKPSDSQLEKYAQTGANIDDVKKKLAHYQFKKDPNCICDTCVDFKGLEAQMPEQFECFIDIAREIAMSKTDY